ncbi:MAG: bifunctional phosphopantothenoylcysteine decarboxylase/phosphopantothenate--cysteine ligase CoaBC [Candidatus Marinimicrobia bacterium]|nr:bifunctional phosphopantothenoylcysteine decarboxylase/phosphopantothenate--cysteine ligase CoaBC [Candidatus Neomarinimicrobiota bacterium]
MSLLRGRSVILGLTGGIAVYKSAPLLRRLTRDHQCNVRVVMTRSAQKFMSPLIFETFSGKEVITDMFHAENEIVGTRHIDLVLEADLFAVIPATANILGKVCGGIADDALSTMLMVSDPRKTVFAPAMNTNMYNNPYVQSNLQKLRDRHYHLIEPETGELATNTEGWGAGRLPDEKALLFYLEKALFDLNPTPLKRKNVLVTGGPTREAIDDIRFISNPSSGKMGIALAESAAKQGANVHYVSGPSALPDPLGSETVHVQSAAEMKKAVLDIYPDQDIVVMAAAVEDIRPRDAQKGKIKKNGIPEKLDLGRTEDILRILGKEKKKQTLVGFSVEMENEIEHSRAKLKEKNLDWIVMNNPQKTTSAFGGDDNRVTVIHRRGESTPLPLLSKEETAGQIWQLILKTEN